MVKFSSHSSHTLQRAQTKAAISTIPLHFFLPRLNLFPTKPELFPGRQVGAVPSWSAKAAWGWTCKYSGHCKPDFKNQSGIPQWCMAWFPKLSCHAGAQVGFIGLMEKLLVQFCNFASHKAQPDKQTSPKSIRGESCRIWGVLIPNFSRSFVFLTLLLFAAGMKIPKPAEKPERPWISAGRAVGYENLSSSGRSCVTCRVWSQPTPDKTRAPASILIITARFPHSSSSPTPCAFSICLGARCGTQQLQNLLFQLVATSGWEMRFLGESLLAVLIVWQIVIDCHPIANKRQTVARCLCGILMALGF